MRAPQACAGTRVGDARPASPGRRRARRALALGAAGGRWLGHARGGEVWACGRGAGEGRGTLAGGSVRSGVYRGTMEGGNGGQPSPRVTYGISGKDHGASSCVATNICLTACTFLLRLTASVSSGGEGGKKANLDIMRRRKQKVGVNVSEAMGRLVERVLAHGLSQSYSKATTQNAMTLQALVMRLGGENASNLTEAMFSYCHAESEYLRKGIERVQVSDSKMDRMSAEMKALREEKEHLEYALRQKELSWEREVAAAKNRAASDASDLARFHSSKREDTERKLVDCVKQIEEIVSENILLRKRLVDAEMELSKVNASAQTALGDALEIQQNAVAMETAIFHERERSQKGMVDHFQKQQGLIKYINELSGVGDMEKVGPPPEDIMKEIESLGGEDVIGLLEGGN